MGRGRIDIQDESGQELERQADWLLRPYREIYTEQYLQEKICEHEDQLPAGAIEQSGGSCPLDWLDLWRQDLERIASRTHMQHLVRIAFRRTLIGFTQAEIAEELSVSPSTVSGWLRTAWASVEAAVRADPSYGWLWVYWREVHRY